MNMKITQKIISIILIVAASTVLSGCGFKKSAPKYKVELEIWGVFDDSDAYSSIISAYRKMNPYVTDIRYKKFNVDTYKQDLLDALASGKGPDIFLIRNSWTPSFQDKIVAAPDAMINERDFRNAFVDVAADDFVGDDKKVYGAPLSVDSLALYYNKDLLNAAGITTPPATWDEFARDAALLTRLDAFGNVIQSGAAMGTGYNINRSTDILSALMFQNGVPFWEKDTQDVNFGYTKGESALKFYTQFADSRSSSYSWNTRQHYSIDSFYEGTAAMMINYSWHYDTLIRKNAKLNIGVAPLPQSPQGQPANYANYWGYVVAKNKDLGPDVTDKATQESARLHEAWEFLKYLTLPNTGKIILKNALSGTEKEFDLTIDPAKVYLEQTQKPAARRDLVEIQKKDVLFGPFAEGNIIAKNWRQSDPEAIEAVLAEAIESVNRGDATVQSALDLARTRVSRLMMKR